MPRHFIFPDINDRSQNSPIFLVEPTQVLGFYNQETKKKEDRVNDRIKHWYYEQAILRGWSDAQFLGNQCLLKISVQVAA